MTPFQTLITILQTFHDDMIRIRFGLRTQLHDADEEIRGLEDELRGYGEATANWIFPVP